MSERYDIIIAGGGLTGLAAAVAFAGPAVARRSRVIVVDPKDPLAGGEGRATAITASSRRLCEALGVWEAIAPHAQPMRVIIVTDSKPSAAARPALLHFGEAEHSGPSAYIVENRYLIAAFLRAAELSDDIVIRIGTEASAYRFGPGLAQMTTKSGEILKANLVAAADGHASPARHAAGIAANGWSYRQSAIVTTVAHELPHNGRAEEHFLPAGPFAILPLVGNRSSLVWTEDTGMAKRLVAMDDEDFLSELKLRFGTHLGKLGLDGPRRAYPLSLQLAAEFTGSRLALIGDAAHVVHPIAGLGFNLGLRDVAALAECVSEALMLGLDPGSAAVLRKYARWRRFDTVMTAAATDGLNRLFSNDLGFLRFIRDAGLRAVDRLSPLKPLFMSEAAGETGRLPKLLRGEPI